MSRSKKLAPKRRKAKTVAAAPAPQPSPQAAQMAAMGAYLYQVLATTVRGAVMFTGAQPQTLLLSAAGAFGSVMGSHFGGDEETVRQFRAACVTAFKAAVDAAPVQPFAKAPQEQQKAGPA